MKSLSGLSILRQSLKICFRLILMGCVTTVAARADEATSLTLPLVGVGQTATEHVASVVANRPQRKLYVGTLSRDAARTGLLVYDLDEHGQPMGKPRRYSDHPDELPAGHHSTPVCLLHDTAHRLLFLGVHGSHATHTRSLVMYTLDEHGEPIQPPTAFDHGNPNKSCDALAIHPQNDRLYAVGWGGEGVFILNRDEHGRPTGKPTWHKFGGYGGYKVAIRADGTKLYRGTYPSVLDVCDLDAHGNIVGQVRSHAIPDGPKEYLQFAATDRAIYVRGADGRLSWFPLNAAGEVIAPSQSAKITGAQAVAASGNPGRLLVAVAAGFDDAISSQPVVNGVEVQEVELLADGSPREIVRRTKSFLRAEAVSLSGGDGAALAAKSLGHGFLGNRITGLKARMTLLSLEAEGTPLPATDVVSFGESPGYLRFAVSARNERVYAVVGEVLKSFALQTTVRDSAKSEAIDGPLCPNASGPIAIDESRGRVLAAREDGSVAAFRLDEQGVLQPGSETLTTCVSAIGALLVNPANGLIYAIGQAGGPGPDHLNVVSIPAGPYVSDAAIDVARRRLYVVGAYHGQENTSVWNLQPDGRLAAEEPYWLADGFKFDKPETRGMLSSVRVDTARHKLYVTGAQENNSTQPGWLIVRDLDERGDPTGSPRLYPSANARGSCEALAFSSDGGWLYESGWGDPRVFVRQVDEQGEPSRESIAWNVGTYGKRQLSLLKVGSRDVLLAGTHPCELESIPLRLPNEPESGAIAALTVESLTEKLGMLSAGQKSDWISLDAALQNGIGPAVVRCRLDGANVKRAMVRWEVARQVGDKLQPVRSVELALVGNVAGLVVPKYGLDDADDLASQIKTSAEEFDRYRRMAEKYSVSPSERPDRLLVANGLIGIDSSGEALEAGMATLEQLGHNTAQIWNWPGVAAGTIREAADRHGIRRFREAIYNPPSYFHYNVDLVQPDSLDKWAAGFRDAAIKMGSRPEELELMHMGDEPGWYYPRVTDDVRNDPQRLAVFREYLKSKNLTPTDLGAAAWDAVEPGRLSEIRTLPQRRLFFWTTRFYAESLSLAFAAATQSLQRQVNPKLLTTTNLNNWPGRFYVPSPGVKIANNTDTGPDAGEGMPDWFDLGRKRAISCIWTEDWFGDRDAQLWSLYGDLLRCSARLGDIEFGGYPVGQSTGAMPDGATLKIASLVGHGAKTIDPYIFGPNIAFGDGWSEKEATYRNLAAALRLVGRADRLLAPGRPRDGSVAIVFPQASQVWDADSKSNCYQQELYGLHAALIHENFPVDFIDDFSLEAGELKERPYAAVYVTAPNLSLKAQRALRQWTEAGGTLVLSPGACAADEYNEPAAELRSLIGATQPDVPRVAPPHYTQAFRIERHPVRLSQPDFDTTDSIAITQTVPLTPTTARTMAAFADDAVAATETTLGRGRLIALGFWPGVTYWLSPDRTEHDRLPSDWSAAARQFATWPARSASAARHVIVSQPGVEACLLESPDGLAVTLLNWTGRPIDSLRVLIPGAAAFKNAAAIEAGPLQPAVINEDLRLTLPLSSADILLLE